MAELPLAAHHVIVDLLVSRAAAADSGDLAGNQSRVEHPSPSDWMPDWMAAQTGW